MWNEDLRLELRANVPMDFKHDVDYGKRMRYEVTRLVKECGGSPGGASKEKPAQEKTKKGKSDSGKPFLHPIPDNVGTVTNDVKFYDETRMCLLNKELQSVMNNCIGKVDQILTDHLAILSFHQGTKKIKVLCSSEDTFLLDIKERFHQFKDFKANNKMRFDDAKKVWSLSAKRQQKSLFNVLKLEQQVVFNAVALLSNADANNANISYVTAGVAVPSTPQTSVSVPLAATHKIHNLTDDFKMYFMKIIRSIDSSGEFETGAFTVYHPAKFPDIYYEGRRGRLNLRPEYSPADVSLPRCLPTPVSVKKPPPKPVVWEPIINNMFGKAIKIIDKNYGLGASYVPLYEDSSECEPFQFLFDIFDIYIGDKDCSELGKKLPDVIRVGDYIKFNGVKVVTDTEEETGASRRIQYMATAMVVESRQDLIKTR